MIDLGFSLDPYMLDPLAYSILSTADFFGGGPHVNPAVTVSMFTLGKCTYTDAFVRIAAQLGGGLVAFPVFHAVSNAMKWEPFGGPEFNMDKDEFATAVSSSPAVIVVALLFLFGSPFPVCCTLTIARSLEHPLSGSCPLRVLCHLLSDVCYLHSELGASFRFVPLHYQTNTNGSGHSFAH